MDGISPEPLPELVRSVLETDDAAVQEQWDRLAAWIKERFGRDAGLEGVLFLMGIQSRGHGYERKLKKEIKQDLIMEGTCCAFEAIGLYRRIAYDSARGTIWECTLPRVPKLPLEQQEKLLRVAILRYFEPHLEISE